MADTRLEWWIANRLNGPGQCWADLVTWVFYRYRSDPDLRSLNPWSPIGESCREDARRCGRCYCGKVAADGSVLGRDETVPSPDPAMLLCADCPHPLPIHPPDGPCSGMSCRCTGWRPLVANVPSAGDER